MKIEICPDLLAGAAPSKPIVIRRDANAADYRAGATWATAKAHGHGSKHAGFGPAPVVGAAS